MRGFGQVQLAGVNVMLGCGACASRSGSATTGRPAEYCLYLAAACCPALLSGCCPAGWLAAVVVAGWAWAWPAGGSGAGNFAHARPPQTVSRVWELQAIGSAAAHTERRPRQASRTGPWLLVAQSKDLAVPLLVAVLPYLWHG